MSFSAYAQRCPTSRPIIMKRTLLALAMLLVATLACNIDRRENATSKFDKKFLIDSSTILDALAQENEDVFFEWKDVSKDALSSSIESVNWSQTDYWRITDALHQVVWNEPLDDMHLFRMHFSLHCGETHRGFQYAQFIFFKIVQTSQGEVRIRHGIEIDPTNNHVAAWETEYSPVLEKWRIIDLPQVNISAEQALQIAEKNGGQEKRMAANNECHISAAISRDTTVYDGWMIIYSPSIFYAEVDPVTGKSY